MNFLRLIVLLFSIQQLCAQSHLAAIRFDKTEHDFGTVIENAEGLIATFTFTNVGNAPLLVSDVQSSCGCTVQDWTKDTVRIGRTGQITVKYTTENRPGSFNKSFTVVSNTKPSFNSLMIKGVVYPKNISVEKRLPAEIGSLRFPSRNITMGTIKTDKVFSLDVEVFNQGDQPLKIEEVQAPDHMLFQINPLEIQPKSSAKISILYNPVKKKEYGFVTDAFILKTNDKEEPLKKLNVIGTIEEHFPELTPQELAQAPKLSILKQDNQLGRIQKGDTKTIYVPIKNTGKKPLKILQLKPSCSCITASAEKYILYQGETTQIQIVLSTSGMDGLQIKTVSIFTNDPQNHAQKISIKADVVK